MATKLEIKHCNTELTASAHKPEVTRCQRRFRITVGAVVFGGIAFAGACAISGGLPALTALVICAIGGSAIVGGAAGAFWHKRSVRILTGFVVGTALAGALSVASGGSLGICLGLAGFGGLSGGTLAFGIELTRMKNPKKSDSEPENSSLKSRPSTFISHNLLEPSASRQEVPDEDEGMLKRKKWAQGLYSYYLSNGHFLLGTVGNEWLEWPDEYETWGT
jgi:hypothetical protein